MLKKPNIMSKFSTFLIFFFFALNSRAIEKEVQITRATENISPLAYVTKSKIHLENNNLDSADYFIDRAGTLLKNQKWPEVYSEQLFQVTRKLFNASYYKKSINKSGLLIENFQKHKSEYYMINALEIHACSHTYMGDFDRAEVKFHDFINYINRLNNETYSKDELINWKTNYYFGMGINEAIQGEFDKSLSWFLKADSILQIGGSNQNKLKCLVYMGNINSELGQYESAISLYKEVEISNLAGEEADMVQVYDNLSVCYRQLGLFEDAEIYLQKGLVVARNSGDSLSVGFNFLNQAFLHEVQNEIVEALWKFEKAIELFELAGNQIMANETKASLVGAAIRIGKTKKEHIGLINEVIDFYSTTNVFEKQLRAYKYKAKALFNLGEFQQSAELFNFRDSLYTDWMMKTYNDRTAELENQYRTNYFKSDAENQSHYAKLLEAENDRKTEIIYASLGFLVFFVAAFVLFLFLNYRLKESRQKIKEQNESLEKRNHEKTVLLKELHHRVKNNLQIVSSLLNLQSIAVKDESAQNAFKDGQNRVDAMAMIHKYLYTTDELTHVDIQSYLARLVESIAYSYNFNKKNINYKFDIDSNPIDVDIAIPFGLIANELVSNAFKHAFKNMEHPELSVSLNLTDFLIFEVKDNGQGMPETIENKESFGMELVQSLIVQLDATLDYSYKDGACFKLSIPQQKITK